MSGQPGPSGQPASPSKPPAQPPIQHHAITNAGVSRGSFTEADATRLSESRGYVRDVTVFANNRQTVPVWSNANWNGTFQTTTNGSTLKQRQIGVGDFIKANRPAIRPQDEPRNPSEYARRFGVLPRTVIRDAWGHSGLTPVDSVFQTSAQPPEDDAYDESLQTLFFRYTSRELVAQGAFNPRLAIPWPPDLDEPVHDLFARQRWAQTAAPPRGYWTGVWNVRYGPALNGTPGVYNASSNQLVWDAIEPALKLASRIIRSNHPFWLAITSMFHLRPVPESKDGRSPEQRAADGGAPYPSVWMDDDENNPRIPAPYPEMATLKGLGFDSAASRTVCMEVLGRYLRFHIGNIEGVLGSTHHWADYNLTIVLGACMIWPLLIKEHLSSGEKATFTFSIASCLLHELAHACAVVHRDLTSRPHLLYSSTFGLKANAALWASMVRLGTQIYGPIRRAPYTIYFDRPLPRQELFFEDEVQGEDGINLEKQLWGGRVVPHLFFSSPAFSLLPVMVLLPWPGHHPQPLQQGITTQTPRSRAYERILTNPRAPSWKETLALPVEWYARYFQQDWWESSFQKFKHQGLKLSTNDPSLPVSLLRTHCPEGVMTDDSDDMAIVFGKEAWHWLIGTVLAMLDQNQHIILSFYMRALIAQATAARVFGTRFENEMLAWPSKSERIVRAARGVSDDYQTMVDLINRHILPGAAAFDAAGAGGVIREMNDGVRRVLGPMLEVSRLMTQDVAYLQFILTQYLHLDAAVRAVFDDNMVALRFMVATNSDILTGQMPNIPLQFSTLVPETEGGWVTMLQQKLATDLLGGDLQNMINGILPQDAEAEAQVFIDLMSEISSLHHGFQTHVNLLNEMNGLIQSATADGRVPDSSDWPRLQSFARVRTQRSVGAFQAAALREFSLIENRALVIMLQEALGLIATKLEPGALDPAQRALMSAADRRAARQAELMQDWRLFLRNQKRLMRERARAREAQVSGVGDDPTPRELILQMWDMADGVADDQRLLGVMYTPETVQQTLDVIDVDLMF